MVAAVRRGESQRSVARLCGVSLATVQFWVQRAGQQRLDRVDWDDRPTTPRSTQRTPTAVEDRILEVRRQLQETSALGFHGAEAIREALDPRRVRPLPSVRTINRILARRGVLDARHRVRRPPPPPGWYLPDVAAHRRELDSFDVVEGLVIRGGSDVEVLNGVSLHGGLVASWPTTGSVTAKFIVDRLIEHWKAFGLPGYAQFDNDTIFQGPHTHVDVVGRVSRLCLSLDVVPVFVTVGEQGFQGMIENYNGVWQSKVWARFQHEKLSDLQERSSSHVGSYRRHRATRIESAPARRTFPPDWRLNLQAPLRGRIIYLRRTDGEGQAELLGHRFAVDGQWANRLVRAEVELERGVIRFYRLRRREPKDQSWMCEVRHRVPSRLFHE